MIKIKICASDDKDDFDRQVNEMYTKYHVTNVANYYMSNIDADKQMHFGYIAVVSYDDLQVSPECYINLIKQYYDYILSEHKVASKEFFNKKKIWKKIKGDIEVSTYKELIAIPEYRDMRYALEKRHKLALIRTNLKKIIKVMEGK